MPWTLPGQVHVGAVVFVCFATQTDSIYQNLKQERLFNNSAAKHHLTKIPPHVPKGRLSLWGKMKRTLRPLVSCWLQEQDVYIINYCKAINNSIGPGMQLLCMPRMCEALGSTPTTTENRESAGLCVLIGRE